jgi:hypothetical protein
VRLFNKKIKLNSKGFGHVEVAFAVVIVAVVATVGVRALDASHALAPSTGSVSSIDESQSPSNLSAIINHIESSKTKPVQIIPSTTSGLPKNTSQVNLNNSTGSSLTGALVNTPNWSGYVDNTVEAGPYNQVSADLNAPKVSCTKAEAQQEEYTLFWVGFDGWNPTNYGGQQWSTVEQDGIWVACGEAKGGGTVAVYGAWWEMYPTNYIQVMGLAIKPGNTIKMTVNYTSTGTYQFKVTNKATGKSTTAEAVCGTTGTCGNSSAEWIAERAEYSGSYSLLIDWHTINFTDATAGINVTSKTASQEEVMPIGDYPNIPVDMVNLGYIPATLLAKVSTSLNNNNSFSDTWHASQ